ncbi:MAG: serine/threonine protein kinase [Hyalangium sp.]|uniref:serine/threonine protein kinase n=1 Tax=Hyalangium sp. TaxID=2028555 RepID=UPI003899AB94
MDSPSPLPLHPGVLPPGTEVGAWRIQGWAGGGAHGAVYRAVPRHDEHGWPVALKLALLPEDPRFAREAALLSGCHDPSIPRLVEQGCWESASGTRHPFLVLQWVDGTPLYAQARLHPLEPARVRRWLGQLAQALAIVHARGAVHRDLKGDNVLVRRSDDRALLMDFGSGLYPGAAPLTPAMGFAGTPLYRSPQAWLFELQHHGGTTARYQPCAADDLYALGVTACRLLTGEYPELYEPFRDEEGTWHVERVRMPRALVSGSWVEPSLRNLTLRLLSVPPEQRGSAAQLARELASPEGSSRRPSGSRALRRRAGRWLTAVAVGLALAVGVGRTVAHELLERPSVARTEPARPGSAEAGTSGLGEDAARTSLDKPSSGAPPEGMKDALPEPQPGQARPDEKGRCPSKAMVILNGGCWTPISWEPEKCQELGGKMFKGVCYEPFIPLGRKHPPTSEPVKNP